MPYRGELQNSVLSVIDDYIKRNRQESSDLFVGLKKGEEGSAARIEEILKSAGCPLPPEEMSYLKNLILNCCVA